MWLFVQLDSTEIPKIIHVLNVLLNVTHVITDIHVILVVLDFIIIVVSVEQNALMVILLIRQV